MPDSGPIPGARIDSEAPARQGVVVVHRADADHRAAHDVASCIEVARRLAALKGFRFDGDYDASRRYTEPVYFVPLDTLIGTGRAQALGIAGEADLFGGVAAHAFVATKSITHPLFDERADAPHGWSPEFPERVRDVALPGFSAFSRDDALRAGLRLLEEGPVRVKPSLGIGGGGQSIAGNEAALKQAVAALDEDELAHCGVALEPHLAHAATYSVGQVRVGALSASYYGRQRLTRNNAGHEVYGGSELVVARGGYEALFALDPTADARMAIEQALAYDHAAFECFAGLLASRRNYDVVQGVDDDGRPRSGVLEQSWRIGGASAAEVAALAAFRRDPALSAVRACTIEAYGEDVPVPAHADVYYRGDDGKGGPLTKYALIEAHGHA